MKGADKISAEELFSRMDSDSTRSNILTNQSRWHNGSNGFVIKMVLHVPRVLWEVVISPKLSPYVCLKSSLVFSHI